VVHIYHKPPKPRIGNFHGTSGCRTHKVMLPLQFRLVVRLDTVELVSVLTS